MPNLIALTGKAGSGKDTAARFIIEAAGGVTMAFADPIKAMLAPVFEPICGKPNWNNRHWKEAPLPGIGVSPRRLAQTLGTEWGRELIDSEIWVTLTMRRVRQSDAPLVVLTDCRFDNEARAVLEAGGEVIEVVRPGVEAVEDHASEAGIAAGLVTRLLVNDGTLDDLRREVELCLV